MKSVSSIEHSLLGPVSTLGQIETLCKEAVDNKYAAICIPPIYVKAARSILGQSNVRIATVIGFPFGYSAVEAKLAEMVLSIVNQADELDVVVNLAALKNDDWQYLANEINTLLPVVRKSNKVIKVILDTELFTTEQIIKACDIYGAAGVDFVQTATGFNGVTDPISAVKLLRKHLADAINIKAIVFNGEMAIQCIAAGASRVSFYAQSQTLAETPNLNGGMIFEKQVNNKS